MKCTLTIGLSILTVFCLLNTSGCEGVSPGVNPTYAVTDAPTQSIMRVRSEYLGTTVAVIPYLNKTLAEYSYLGDAAVGILPEYLLEAGFQPIEAAQGAELDKVLAELRYGQSDQVNPATAVQFGQQLGAKYVFLGEVNNYRVVRGKGGRSLDLGGKLGLDLGFNLGKGGITYDLQVSGRLVSVETRAIVASKSLAHNQTFNLTGGGISTPWGTFNQDQQVNVEQDIGGKVLGVALNRLVAEIVDQLNSRVPAINKPVTTTIPTAVPPTTTPTAPPTTASTKPAAQSGSKFCTGCGALLTPGAKFCGSCGKKVSED
ncbi:MAG: hypothetical protein JW837_07245 [Sedimentisphaerales bacterium]|nr:hypothetical protein [Sedimentisphaerales bacterium]